MSIDAEEATLKALVFLRKVGHQYLIALGAELKGNYWLITFQSMNIRLTVNVNKFNGKIIGYKPTEKQK